MKTTLEEDITVMTRLLEFKISYYEAATSVLNLYEIIIINLKSYGYKFKHYTATLNKKSFDEMIKKAGIEIYKISILEDEQCYMIEIY
jgi:hypothetical protein